MKSRNRHFLLPATLVVGSFLFLLLIMFLTDPIKNVSYAILFFAFLLILLLSLGHMTAYLWAGRLSPKTRYRILIISVLLVVIAMFRSIGALNWIDLLVMTLLSSGLLFYSGRRSL